VHDGPDAIMVQRLLDELCVDLGFCLPADEQQRLRQSPPADVDVFTDAVFHAEGMDPGSDRRLRTEVRQRIARWADRPELRPPRPRHGADQRAAGEHRVRYAELFDAEVRSHNERFRAAAGVRADDRVLDVGCGTGQSTRDAARAALAGSVLGVDVSAPALDVARQLSEQDGLHNVTYELADAQAHRFPPGQFDLCISRFGTMFFTDPVAAFANIGHALRPGARLVLLVWQDRARNEWATAVRQALTADPTAPVPGNGGPDPFSLGDQATTEAILTSAGFADVAFADVHEPVYYGPDVATAYDVVAGLREPTQLLAGLAPAASDHARRRLRATLADHHTGTGVHFDSRAWVITAHRRSAHGRPARQERDISGG
jgi:SAM-dependent methyltransferase